MVIRGVRGGRVRAAMAVFALGTEIATHEGAAAVHAEQFRSVLEGNFVEQTHGYIIGDPFVQIADHVVQVVVVHAAVVFARF